MRHSPGGEGGREAPLRARSVRALRPLQARVRGRGAEQGGARSAHEDHLDHAGGGRGVQEGVHKVKKKSKLRAIFRRSNFITSLF